MATIHLDRMLEFFVLGDELAEWTSRWVRELGLYGLVMRRRPFSVVNDVDWADVELIKSLLPQFDELILGIQPLESEVNKASDLVMMNPDRLEIQLPRLTARGLRSSGIGSVTTNPAAKKIWKIVVRDVMEKTSFGMWMFSESGPSKRYFSKLRYSQGASVVHSGGVNLLTFAAETPVLIVEPEF